MNGFFRRISRFSYPFYSKSVVDLSSYESFSVWVFGQNIEALRLFSALAGALTVGMVYLLGRSMFGQPAALLAALLLTGSHFHIHFSRLGLNNVWDGLLFTVILGGLWYGWQHGYRTAFLVAGLALGMAQYLYASTRLLFILIPAWVLIAGLLERERLRRALPGLFWMGIVAFVGAVPLGWFYFNNPNEFWAPLHRVAIDREWIAGNAQRAGVSEAWIVVQQFSLGLRAYTLEHLRGFYLPKTPLLRPVAGGLFVAGVALLALRPTASQRWLVLLWVIGFGMMTGLTHEPTAAQRFVAAAPAIALVIDFGLQEIVHILSPFVPSARFSLQLVAIGAVLWLAADDIRFYFWEFAPQSALIADNNLVANRLAHYLSEQPEGTQVIFFENPRMSFYSHAGLPFLASQVQGKSVSAPPDQVSPRPTGHVIFVVLPEQQDLLPSLQTTFPGGMRHEEETSEEIPLYTLYEGNW